jgi:putative endonuclease
MRDTFQPCVYLLANRPNGVIYCGVTSNLLARVYQHREGQFGGFSHDHSAHKLIWFEQHATMDCAILREKRIKKWNRAWKIRLIEEANPDWRDLAADFGFEPLRVPYATNPRHPRAGGGPSDEA